MLRLLDIPFCRQLKKHRQQTRQRVLGMELLEDRCLMTVVSLTPVKDNSIYSGYPNNSNAKGLLYVGLNNDGDNIKRALLDFDVAGSVPAGATVNSVSLSMYVVRNNNGGNLTAELHKLTADWGEGTSLSGSLTKSGGKGTAATTNDATWTKSFYNTVAWATPGGDFSPSVSGSTTVTGPDGVGYFTWASTAQMVADVQDWLNNPNAAYGWILKGSSASELVNSSHAFYPREGSVVAQRPTLTIDYTVGATNQPPTLSTIADPAAINQNAGLQSINLAGISAGTGETQTLQVTAASDNTALIPNPTVSYTSPNATGSISYQPVANQFGTAHVTVTVRDAGLNGTLGNADDGTLARTFTVVVYAVNQPPTLNVITDPVAINQDAGLQTINLAGISAGTGETQALQITAASDNTALIPNPTVGYTSPNATGSLSYQPVAGESGSAHMTVTVRDAGLDGVLGNTDDATLARSFSVVVVGRGAIVTLNPIKDNTLIQNATGAQSNGAGDVFVGQIQTGDMIRRGLLAFDIAGSVPAGAVIQSVALTMYVTQTQLGDQAVELHQVSADWGQAGSSGAGGGAPAQPGDATWLHTFYNTQLWTTPGGDFSPTVSGMATVGSQGVSYTWNSSSQMVADVQQWLNQPGTNFGWMLKAADEVSNSAKRLASRESTNAAQRPRLAISYTIPTTPATSIAGRTDGGDWWEARSDGAKFVNSYWGHWASIAWQDVHRADVNGDGEVDIVGRTTVGDWWVAKSDGTKFVNEAWGAWSPVTWLDVQAADVNGDGKDDLVGRTSGGQWTVARSDGTKFTVETWGNWSPITWLDVQAADVNGDGKADLVGRTSNGYWWAAKSNGTQFNNEALTYWSPVTWHDVQAADLNGDGRADLAGRTDGGFWWASLATDTGFVNQYWGSWVPDGWSDVQAVDVNGDHRTDLVGRYTTGTWWVGRSDGTKIIDEFWGYWSPINWHDMQVGYFATTAPALLASDGEANASPWTPSLTAAEVTPIVNEAIARWTESGLPAAIGDAWSNTSIVIMDLPGSELGHVSGGTICLDQNAAGHGWFLDPTPSEDEEFTPAGPASVLVALDSPALDRLDLLSVVEHELGHLGGLPDLNSSIDNLMDGQLATGVRRHVTAANVDAVYAHLGRSG